MADSFNLKPGNLYLLRLEDRLTGQLLPYVKIGITEHNVSDRIRALQTGSPF